MKHTTKKWIVPALSAALAISLLAGCGSTESGTGNQSATEPQTPSATQSVTVAETAAVIETAVPVAAEVDESGATAITLSATSASITGSGASVENSVVTITEGGTYILTGTLTDGQVIVDAKGEDVTLVLNGASVTCSYGSAIYVYKSASTTIHLADGSENVLSDGGAYSFADGYSSSEEDEPNACLYSKSDLIIQGSGILTVYGNYNNGITSKDTLTIVDASVAVAAANNGITGKDSVEIANAAIIVSCGGDAIRSTNDTDAALGYVRIAGSDLTLVAGEDGIQAETVLTIDGGDYEITTGGGSSVRSSDETSAKGLKAGTEIALLSGTFTLDCSDDAIHTNGSITIDDGGYTLSSGDDAIHADELVTVNGGTFEISAAEGIEGTYIRINDGVISIEASDDGINAARKSNVYSPTVEINGGEITIVMGPGDTDGIDSNGDIIVNGGTIDVTGNSAFDYDGSAQYNGGTIIVNGQQVDSIPNQMMGGFGGFPGGGQQGGWGSFPGGDGGQQGGFPGGGFPGGDGSQQGGFPGGGFPGGDSGQQGGFPGGGFHGGRGR